MKQLSILKIGAVTPLGIGGEYLTPIALFRAIDQFSNIGCAILKDFSAVNHLPSTKNIKFLTRSTIMSLIAVNEVVDNYKYTTDRLGVVIGTQYSSLQTISDFDYTVITEGPSYVSAMVTPNTLVNTIAAHISITYQAKALNSTISTGSCSSLDALGYAATCLNNGLADGIIVGGVDEANSRVQEYANNLDINGIGEGAGIVLLSNSSTEASFIYLNSWVSYYSSRINRKDLLIKVCFDAMKQANCTFGDISLLAIGAEINEANSILESLAKIMSEVAPLKELPCFSLRPWLGNTFGADGILHIIAAAHSLRDGLVPPTFNKDIFVNNEQLKFYNNPETFLPAYALVIESDNSNSISAVIISNVRQV